MMINHGILGYPGVSLSISRQFVQSDFHRQQHWPGYNGSDADASCRQPLAWLVISKVLWNEHPSWNGDPN